MTQVLVVVDFVYRYKKIISNADTNAGKKLSKTEVKRFWRRVCQFEIKLDWVYNWILTLIIFMKHSQKMYNHKKMSQNISVKPDINLE